MAEPEAFDPTHALDGWRPPARADVSDLTLDALLDVGAREDTPPVSRAKSASFDPTHLLDGWRPPAPAPLDLDLKSLLRVGSGPDPAKLARLKARGYEMLDVEDVELAEPPAPRVVLAEPIEAGPPAPPVAETHVEAPRPEAAPEGVDLPLPDEGVWPQFTEEAEVVDAAASPAEPGSEGVEAPPAAVAEVAAAVEAPVLDFHASPPEPARALDDIRWPAVAPPPAEVEAPVLEFRAEPPPAPDPVAVIDGIELPQVVPPPAVVETPELDIAALAPIPPQPDPRLLAHWQPGAWTGLARRVASASAELVQTPGGPCVENHAPQWLCAIWPPQAADAAVARWPELAALLAGETLADALQQLLGELPEAATLWSADLEADWHLVAELVLHRDAGLRPSQVGALRQLAEAERQACLARFSEGYALQGRVARRHA